MKGVVDHRFARVLAVVAHMDDEALFCGGTLRRLRDQGCEIHIAAATSVETVNAAATGDRERQHRRLVAFGHSCGMIGASRSYLLDVRNSKAAQPFDTVEYESIYDELSDKLAPLLDEISPSIMLTHGSEGEYGHPQHVLTSRVVRSIWNGPLWSFNANGHERVQVDAAWKRRLLDSYRYGTTQDAFWTPYTAIPATSPLGPWLGDTEPFLRVQ